MTLSNFEAARVQLYHNDHSKTGVPYPPALDNCLSRQQCHQAYDAIRQWPGYEPTPLRRLSGLAGDLGVAEVLYKDEGPRFGLGSFKALGGAYAVLRLLVREVEQRTGKPVHDREITDRQHDGLVSQITVATATDGNHGRSVAWGARQFGCGCKIYMHAGVSEERARAVEDYGAEVVRVNGNYDESVHQAAQDAAENGWFIVSDTSYEGYMELPRQVMAGYTVMTQEILSQLPGGQVPTHVFLQGGVGGLAAAVAAHLWQAFGADRPRVVIVEPTRADCLYQSAVSGVPTAVHITEETVMAGLSCGEVSQLAWQILSDGADDFMTIEDDLVAPAMRLLASGGAGEPVVAGESAVAGLAGLIAAAGQQALASALGLDGTSRILVIGTEGATDPAIYKALVGQDPDSIAA